MPWKASFRFIVCVLALAATGCADLASEMRIRRTAHDATFLLMADTSLRDLAAGGTAFRIGENEYEPAAHVLNGIIGSRYANAVLLDHDDKPHKVVSILRYSDALDIAVVSLESEPPGARSLRPRKLPLIPAERLFLAGYANVRRERPALPPPLSPPQSRDRINPIDHDRRLPKPPPTAPPPSPPPPATPRADEFFDGKWGNYRELLDIGSHESAPEGSECDRPACRIHIVTALSQLSSGFSGGPVLDGNGDLVGIISQGRLADTGASLDRIPSADASVDATPIAKVSGPPGPNAEVILGEPLLSLGLYGFGQTLRIEPGVDPFDEPLASWQPQRPREVPLENGSYAERRSRGIRAPPAGRRAPFRAGVPTRPEPVR